MLSVDPALKANLKEKKEVEMISQQHSQLAPTPYHVVQRMMMPRAALSTFSSPPPLGYIHSMNLETQRTHTPFDISTTTLYECTLLTSLLPSVWICDEFRKVGFKNSESLCRPHLQECARQKYTSGNTREIHVFTPSIIIVGMTSLLVDFTTFFALFVLLLLLANYYIYFDIFSIIHACRRCNAKRNVLVKYLYL